MRVAIETDRQSALLYSASQIELLDDAGLAQHPYLEKLGPDVLDERLVAADVEALLREKRFAGRRLGHLLLDQGFLAGLGNYLRSEIAFEARLHPDRCPRDLTRNERRRLARAAIRVSRRAYRSGGVTLPVAQSTALRREGATWAQSRHWVFARARRDCRVCGTKVSRVDRAGRRIYLCVGCQPGGAL